MSITAVCAHLSRRCNYHPWRDCDNYNSERGYCDACRGYQGRDGTVGNGAGEYHKNTECIHARVGLRTEIKKNSGVVYDGGKFVWLGRRQIPVEDVLYLSIDDGINSIVLIDRKEEIQKHNKGGNVW